MIQIINDTCKVSGKWSQKRLISYLSFWAAFLYAFSPLFVQAFEVKEFVFIGFLGMGGFSIFRTQQLNKNSNEQTNNDTAGN